MTAATPVRVMGLAINQDGVLVTIAGGRPVLDEQGNAISVPADARGRLEINPRRWGVHELWPIGRCSSPIVRGCRPAKSFDAAGSRPRPPRAISSGAIESFGRSDAGDGLDDRGNGRTS
jgi:hypothetical protein